MAGNQSSGRNQGSKNSQSNESNSRNSKNDSKGVQGGSSEQHAEAGRQSNKNK